jgi:hypothetical protein
MSNTRTLKRKWVFLESFENCGHFLAKLWDWFTAATARSGRFVVHSDRKCLAKKAAAATAPARWCGFRGKLV